MATVLKAGARFKSAVCDTQVMVVKAPPGEHQLGCGGVDMLGGTATAPDGVSLAATLSGGTSTKTSRSNCCAPRAARAR